MSRIPLIGDEEAGPAELVAAIRARRGGHLLNIDRMLLHSPALAVGWSGFLRAVRTELALAPRDRELAMCAVAILTGTDYEIRLHRPEFLKAGGTPDQFAAIGDPAAEDADGLFSDTDRAILGLARAMVANTDGGAEAVAAVRAGLGQDSLVVELVGVIAAYAMVCRFLQTLGVQPE